MNSPRLARLKEICKPFPFEKYKSIDNNRLAVYAISLLSKHNLEATQEGLIIALFLLFPQKFSLVGFSEYPDAERVCRTLLQLGQKYRNWATGNRHIGYSLNHTGKLVLEQTKNLLKNSSTGSPGIKTQTPKQRTRDPNKEVREIEDTALFKAFRMGKKESPNEFSIWELLQAFPYTPRNALNRRLKQMKESARLSKRSDVLEFLEWVHAKYKEIF